MNWLGNQFSRFTEFSLLEQQFRSLVPFVSILSHLELDLYSVCFFWIPNSLRKVRKNFESLSQPDGLVGKLEHLVH